MNMLYIVALIIINSTTGAPGVCGEPVGQTDTDNWLLRLQHRLRHHHSIQSAQRHLSGDYLYNSGYNTGAIDPIVVDDRELVKTFQSLPLEMKYKYSNPRRTGRKLDRLS